MADLARLDDYAADVLRAGTAPALAVALTDRERTLAVRTYGQAAPEMLWPIGSIGKCVAAVIALQLVDERVLALDAADHPRSAVVRSPERARPDHAAPPADPHGRAHRLVGSRARVGLRRHRAGRDRTRLRAGRAPVLLRSRLSHARRAARARHRPVVPRSRPGARLRSARDARFGARHRARHPAPASRRPCPVLRRPAVAARARARARAVDRVRGGRRVRVLHARGPRAPSPRALAWRPADAHAAAAARRQRQTTTSTATGS